MARALNERGELKRLYTDFWAGENPLFQRAPGPLRSLATRRHPDVAATKVTAFNSATLGAATQSFFAAKLNRRSSGVETDYREYERGGRDFARRCVRDLARRGVSAERDAFFGYNTGCLETLRWLQGRGVPTIVGQIDPGRVEEDLVRAESEKWPGWATNMNRIPDSYFTRLQAEWDAATRVLVNSPWSRDALIQQGVDPQKIVVVPLAYEAPQLPQNASHHDDNAPLRVLWLGSVLLRKGIQYLLEAATLLQQTDIRFVVAGPIDINESKIANAPKNVEFIGRVERNRASELYQQSDIFVLPTLSDGFAITQIEAMAHCLPVITTAHCGEVVTPGVDGEIVPICDGAALAEAILKFDRNRELLHAMSEAALQKSRQFSLETLADNLENTLGAL